MEKKRSVGVTVFAWLWLITAVSAIMLALMSLAILAMPQENKVELLNNPATQQLGIMSIAELDKYYQSQIKRMLPLGIVVLIVAIGLFKLKKWASVGIILVAIWGMGWTLIMILNLSEYTTFHNIGVFLSLLQSVLTVYFFTRPKVKEQFK